MKLTITLPKDLHDSLLQRAGGSKARLNQEVISALESHVSSHSPFTKETLKDIGMTTLMAGLSAVTRRIGGSKQ